VICRAGVSPSTLGLTDDFLEVVFFIVEHRRPENRNLKGDKGR